MKSYMAKTNEVDQKWVLVDASDAVLGRMARPDRTNSYG